jgi:hypothetical protein
VSSSLLHAHYDLFLFPLGVFSLGACDLLKWTFRAWQEREAVDQLQAEFERQREEVEKLRRKGASKMVL